MNNKTLSLVFLSLPVILLVASCDSPATPSPTPVEEFVRDANVPDLPFPDNPDPNACGIPINWGKDDPAWLTGYYQGELVQPIVFMYDSHLRQSITGQAPSGAKVKIILFQENPTLDFYLVRTMDQDPIQEGWIPAPFLSFEPIE
jgi:hypothetical protein